MWYLFGVTIALKSMFGAIHNPNKYHMNVGNPYVADVFMLPPIRQKVRLHICDATTAQYGAGPLSCLTGPGRTMG